MISGRRKSRERRALDDARRERDQVRQEGEDALPVVRRLERRDRENHLAEIVAAVLRSRRA